jgi:hypothetical protein
LLLKRPKQKTIFVEQNRKKKKKNEQLEGVFESVSSRPDV